MKLLSLLAIQIDSISIQIVLEDYSLIINEMDFIIRGSYVADINIGVKLEGN